MLEYPMSICMNPRRPGSYFIGDRSSIRYVDTVRNTVSVIAGSAHPSRNFKDGPLVSASFYGVMGLLCTRDGRHLFVTDHHNGRIRSIDIESQKVTTLDGGQIEYPRKMAFDVCLRAALDDGVREFVLESRLCVTADHGIIRRYAIDTTGSGDGVSVSYWNDLPFNLSDGSGWLDVWGIAITSRGHLIVSCQQTHSIYLFSPTGLTAAHAQRIGGCGGHVRHSEGFADGAAGESRFDWPADLVLVEPDRCVYVCDRRNRRIRCVTIAQSLLD